MDRGAPRATVHRVTKSQTRLKRLRTHACLILPACFLTPMGLLLTPNPGPSLTCTQSSLHKGAESSRALWASVTPHPHLHNLATLPHWDPWPLILRGLMTQHRHLQWPHEPQVETLSAQNRPHLCRDGTLLSSRFMAPYYLPWDAQKALQCYIPLIWPAPAVLLHCQQAGEKENLAIIWTLTEITSTPTTNIPVKHSAKLKEFYHEC